MKKAYTSLIVTLVALLVLQPVFSWAGPGARVIPQGKVSILSEGKQVSQFQSEMPLPEGSLMLCNGSCLVQMQNLQLVALDRAVFALTEGKTRWELTVKSGEVDFAMRAGAKPISFHTPHDTIQAERAIVSATNTAMVRGSIIVSETESVLAIQEGTLQVVDADGTQLVQPGQTIRLMTQPAAAGTASTGTGTTTAVGAGTGAAAGAGAVAGGIAGLSTTTLVLIGAGVAAVTATALAIGLSSGGGGTTPVSGQ